MHYKWNTILYRKIACVRMGIGHDWAVIKYYNYRSFLLSHKFIVILNLLQLQIASLQGKDKWNYYYSCAPHTYAVWAVGLCAINRVDFNGYYIILTSCCCSLLGQPETTYTHMIRSTEQSSTLLILWQNIRVERLLGVSEQSCSTKFVDLKIASVLIYCIIITTLD